MTPHVLYRFYAADGTLLYVGITCNVSTRWTTHARKRDWWVDVASCTLEHFPDRESVLAAERSAILTERPTWNVIHNRGWAPGDESWEPAEAHIYSGWWVVAAWVAIYILQMFLMIGESQTDLNTALMICPIVAAAHVWLAWNLAALGGVEFETPEEAVARRWASLRRVAA